MTLPATGQISLSQVQTEFGGSNPVSLSEYRNNNHGGPLANMGTYGWTSWKLGGLHGRRNGGWEGINGPVSNASIVIPVGIVGNVFLYMLSGGGGGGGGWGGGGGFFVGGGGGGSGGYYWPTEWSIVPGATYFYDVGDAGAGGAAGAFGVNGSPGGAGGATNWRRSGINEISIAGGGGGGGAGYFYNGYGGAGASPGGVSGAAGSGIYGGAGGALGFSNWGNGGKGGDWNQNGFVGVPGLIYIRWNS